MSNYFAPDGYRYGVKFVDGSIADHWNGKTQRLRVEEQRERWLRDQREWLTERGSGREPDLLVVVRRKMHGEWEEVPD